MDKIVFKTNENFKLSQKPVVVNSLFGNIYVKFILIAFSVFLFYNVYHSIMITLQKLEISRTANREVNDLRVKNLKLAMELESMKTVEFLEIQARDRLNLSGESEYVFVLNESLMESAKDRVDAYLYGDLEKGKQTGYSRWLEFFSDGV